MGFALVFAADIETRLYAFRAIRLLRYDVGCVSTLDEAMAFAADHPSMLVVEDSPDGQHLIDHCSKTTRLVLVDGKGTHTRGTNVHFFSRSSSPEALLNRVRPLLRPTVDHMAWFRLPENLHIACEGQHSVKLACKRGAQTIGAIVVHKGEVWSAQDEHGQGLDACTRLLADPEVTSLAIEIEDPDERNVEGDWRHIMFDAARQQDERVQTFDEHVRDGTRAVLQGRSENALEHFLKAKELNPNHPIVAHNIAQLEAALNN